MGEVSKPEAMPAARQQRKTPLLSAHTDGQSGEKGGAGRKRTDRAAVIHDERAGRVPPPPIVPKLGAVDVPFCWVEKEERVREGREREEECEGRRLRRAKHVTLASICLRPPRRPALAAPFLFSVCSQLRQRDVAVRRRGVGVESALNGVRPREARVVAEVERRERGLQGRRRRRVVGAHRGQARGLEVALAQLCFFVGGRQVFVGQPS